MNPIPHVWAVALALLVSAGMGRADVVVTHDEAEGAYHIETDAYQATVASDGCLTSLRIDGLEFFQSADGNPRGAYLWLEGPLQLTTIEHPEPNAITAGSEKATARYEFADSSMKWTVANLTDERMLLLIVFDPAIDALKDQWGAFMKPPLD